MTVQGSMSWGWAAGALLLGCAGDGTGFAAIEETVVGKCATCHNQGTVNDLIADVIALDDSAFTEVRFPDLDFPDSLTEQSTEALIAAASPPRDGSINPATATRKAWVLHLLHELDVQLSSTPPSDFSRESSFNAYNALGTPPSACESIDRLGALAELELPQQMPPTWTRPLFTLLGREPPTLTTDERATLIESIEAGLPDGLASCLLR